MDGACTQTSGHQHYATETTVNLAVHRGISKIGIHGPFSSPQRIFDAIKRPFSLARRAWPTVRSRRFCCIKLLDQPGLFGNAWFGQHRQQKIGDGREIKRRNRRKPQPAHDDPTQRFARFGACPR